MLMLFPLQWRSHLRLQQVRRRKTPPLPQLQLQQQQ
jgi:hypothetical protein